MTVLVVEFNRSEYVPASYTGCVLYPNGSKQWFVKGKLSRKDGPVSEAVNGYKEWKLETYFYTNATLLSLKDNYIVLEQGIPAKARFGKLKLTQAKLLTANGTMFVYDNLPGIKLKEGSE